MHEYVKETKNPHFIPYIYEIRTIGSILATVNPPPKGRLRKGMYAQTSARAVAIASIIADVVRRVTFVDLVITTSYENKN